MCNGFKKNGCSVTPFKWNLYFKSEGNFIARILRRVEYKFVAGFSVRKVNEDLLKEISAAEYDLLFLYRPNLISWKIIAIIKRKFPNLIVAAYNNDDPFSITYNGYVWRKFKRALPYYDIVFSYRPSNIEEYYDAGAKKVYLLPPWFDPVLSYPVSLNKQDSIKYNSDIVFVGHYEDDGRINILRRLVSEGFKVSLYGPEWNSVIKNDPVLHKLYPVSYLHGEAYNKAISGAALALVIYSKLNNDVYTRRCFEIPAIKTLMLAKRTSEMLELFEEDVEAVYFSDTDELVEKAKDYLADKNKIELIAANGFRRALESGYDVEARAKSIIKLVEQAIKNQ